MAGIFLLTVGGHYLRFSLKGCRFVCVFFFFGGGGGGGEQLHRRQNSYWFNDTWQECPILLSSNKACSLNKVEMTADSIYPQETSKYKWFFSVWHSLCLHIYIQSTETIRLIRESTETIRLIREGRGKRGYAGGGRGKLYIYHYTVTTRMTPALRRAAVRSILMFL